MKEGITMSEKFTVRVSLDFEVDKSPITKDNSTTREFIEQNLQALPAYFEELTSKPTYLGPKVIVRLSTNETEVVESPE
jgi:hypothetical protein